MPEIPTPTPADLERDAAADIEHVRGWKGPAVAKILESWIRRWNAEKQRADTAEDNALVAESAEEEQRLRAEEAEAERDAERQARLAAEAEAKRLNENALVSLRSHNWGEEAPDPVFALVCLTAWLAAELDKARAALEAEEAAQRHFDDCDACEMQMTPCPVYRNLCDEARRLRRDALGREEGGQTG